MEQDTITMAILIAKVYKKKERVFYAQQNIHHQEQKQEDGHLLKVMSAWFPQKKPTWWLFLCHSTWQRQYSGGAPKDNVSRPQPEISENGDKTKTLEARLSE